MRKCLNCSTDLNAKEVLFCGTCLFWRRQADTPGGLVDENWEHYRVATVGTMGGFAGRRFRVKTGNTIMATGLWGQGAIPASCRKWFVINSEITEIVAANATPEGFPF